MKRIAFVAAGCVLLGAAFVVIRGPLRLRRLNHNFDFIQLQMSEAQVTQVLGEQGATQPCTTVQRSNCDHELVYNLKFPDFLTVEFDKQSRVIGKWRSP